MKIFKNAWFERYARKQLISDEALLDAVKRAELGLIDADLGGGVIKQRLARVGQGKSGGFRTIVIYRTQTRAFFMFGFAKSDQANISHEELAQFKLAASELLNLPDKFLDTLLKKGQLIEVKNGDETIS